MNTHPFLSGALAILAYRTLLDMQVSCSICERKVIPTWRNLIPRHTIYGDWPVDNGQICPGSDKIAYVSKSFRDYDPFVQGQAIYSAFSKLGPSKGDRKT